MRFAIKYLTKGMKKLPFKTIKDTIIALENSKVDRAIVPIENSFARLCY